MQKQGGLKQLLTGILLFSLTLNTLAKPLSSNEIPDALKPWQAFVLHGQEQTFCPLVSGNTGQRYCAWPGLLSINAENTAGGFSQQWEVLQPSWISLPGDQKYWPLAVKANAQNVAVIEREGRPMVWLQPGIYTVTGQWQWSRLPSSLSLAAETAVVSVAVNGKPLPINPDSNNVIWLQQSAKTSNTPAHVQTRVFRRLQDGVPLTMQSRIELDIAGDNREIIIGPVLLAEQLPVNLISDLPACLESNGQLRVQARAGKWVVTIDSRYLHPQEQFSFNKPTADWPAQEIWSIAQSSELRAIDIKGGVRVDAAQYDVPLYWREFPAVLLHPDETLSITTAMQDETQSQKNQLNLQRTAWLDFSGQGYTLQDEIQGTLREGWRLEVNPPLVLGLAREGENNRLITTLTDNGLSGVELRNRDLAFHAVLRKEGAVRDLPADGWNQTFDTTSLRLHLPPGWMLLATQGTDTVDDTFVSQWKLLDIFLVLMIAIATFRLQGRLVGFIALVTLLLTYHAPGAPLYSWIIILLVMAIARGLPQANAQRWLNRALVVAYAGLLVLAVPFLIEQARLALYPQLEHLSAEPPANIVMLAANTLEPPVVASVKPVAKMMMAGVTRALPPPSLQQEAQNTVDALANNPRIVPPAEVVDPKARIQTGPALPDWQWTVVNMNWSGPVVSNTIIKLWLLSPWQTRLWHVLSVLGVIALVAGLLGAFRKGSSLSWRLVTQHLGLWLFVAVSVTSGMMYTPLANAADFPSTDLLQQLRAGLTEPDDCLPQCAQVEQVDIRVIGNQLTLNFTIDAVSDVAVPLLRWNDQVIITQVQLDHNASVLRRLANNDLAVHVAPGVHQINIVAQVANTTAVNISFASGPRWLNFISQDWQVAGIIDGQLQGDSVQLMRRTPTVAMQDDSFTPTHIPPFVRIDRRLELGLQWTLITKVTRVAPTTGAIALEIPLLGDEAVITDGITVRNNKVLLTLGADQYVTSWRSILPIQTSLSWQAADNTLWAERWRVQPSHLWHLNVQGLSPIHSSLPIPFWQIEWQPWPGQSVQLDVIQPMGVAGDTITIDKADWVIAPGARATDVDLHLTLRSSLGDKQIIDLPTSATITRLMVNQVEVPIVQQDNQLALDVQPGTTDVAISWREAQGLGIVFKPADIKLDKAVSNVRTTVNLSDDRWIVGLGGPLMGPAVLFWPIAMVMVLIAIVLGQSRFSPLRIRDWILLSLGVSVATPLSVFVVAAWLYALQWRKNRASQLSAPAFCSVQVSLVALTAVVLSLLIYAIAQGLLGAPDMMVMGNQSIGLGHASLHWYQDSMPATGAGIWILSLPVWVYQVFMLIWALWLAFALIRWLRWGWECFSLQGLWRK